jgi:hypothetical protein
MTFLSSFIFPKSPRKHSDATREGREIGRETHHQDLLGERGSNMADGATVHIGGLDLQRQRTTDTTSTTAAKDLVDVDPIGDGISSCGELQRVKAMALHVIALGPPRRNEGEPRFVRL